MNDILIEIMLISIHALREESDVMERVLKYSIVLNFNPRSPRGERPYFVSIPKYLIRISIHALREESDL